MALFGGSSEPDTLKVLPEAEPELEKGWVVEDERNRLGKYSSKSEAVEAAKNRARNSSQYNKVKVYDSNFNVQKTIDA